MSSTIFLYSKYSSHCKSLTEIIQKSGVDFQNLYNLKFLCVDNGDVRRFLLGNKKIQINIVPTILVIFPDGIVEKYEAATALDWVGSIIAKHRPPPPPVSESMTMRTKLPDPEPAPKQRESQGEPDYIYEGRTRRIKKALPPRKEHRRPSAPKRTAIDELPEEELSEEEAPEDYETESEPESDNEEDSVDSRKYRRMRTGGNTEKYNEHLFQDPKPSNTGAPTGSIRGKNGKVNVSTIMAQAQAMQKNRESIDKRPPLGAPPPRGGTRL